MMEVTGSCSRKDAKKRKGLDGLWIKSICDLCEYLCALCVIIFYDLN